MTQFYKPMLAAIHLTYPQYLVMLVLWGQKDLAERLQQDSGSITPLVKRLEAEGYLLRQRDPRDERNRVLTLTPAGRDLRQASSAIDQAIADNCSVIAPELEQAFAKKINATTTVLQTSHVPMLSQPKQVAEVILAAVAKR